MSPTPNEQARARGHKLRDIRAITTKLPFIEHARNAELARIESHRQFSVNDMAAAVAEFQSLKAES